MATEEDASSIFSEAEDGSAPVTGNGIPSDVDEEDDDVQPNSRRKPAANGEINEETEGDLFGEEEEDEPVDAEPHGKRKLDDEELDSGDDEDRADRVAEEEDGVQYEQQERLAMDLEISRQAVPEPSDGEMYLMKVPGFMSIEPNAWQIGTFQPPTTDHHSKTASSTFSAYNTALSTVRWRHSPGDSSELQSNARINRWSDGSLTVQLASDPTVQYEIDGNALAPPQRNPAKPTPISIQSGSKGGRHGLVTDDKYELSKDANTFLIVPVETAEALRVTHKITAGLTVKQTASAADNALEQLQVALANAANATKVGGATGTIEITTEDPELGRKRAEQLERQLTRDKKRRDNAAERERLRADRTLGRAGLSSGRYGGLNVGMLEDDEMDGGHGGAPAKKARAKPRGRRNSEYSSEEELGRKRFNREDSYDQEDDFLAPSDEEEEVVEDDEDEDDGIVEQSRERTPKRDRPTQESLGEDADAEGEVDEDVQQTRTKRRRIVDEDEDE